MSDIMRPIPFDALMKGALSEYARTGRVFGVKAAYRHGGRPALDIFGEKLELPIGPAAGPHTQLAQNIIAAYAAGARFFELKTVQTLDGAALHVQKPCIEASDEGYNVEWSTELYVPQALDEYVKAYFALRLISVAMGLGRGDGFVFNMSVGYDLTGIRSEKIDGFIEGLKDARNTGIWRECMRWARENMKALEGVDESYLGSLDGRVCRSVTLSTLHGCPPDEIERIASYLITEKGLNTFVKCNPTLLGYETARSVLDDLGYGYMSFSDRHFREDLQFSDAIPMFGRLKTLAEGRGLTFGLKLSNTFPVDIKRNELPGDEMYMSGRALFPLTALLAARIEREFGGDMRVSFSGGADETNVMRLLSCGVWPVTMATTLLKPGGCERLTPMAEAASGLDPDRLLKADLEGLRLLAENAAKGDLYRKALKPAPPRKAGDGPPLLDCFISPCSEGCPIHQDIPAYLEKARQGRYAEALSIICRKNPLPFITGTLCGHRCRVACTRGYYESPIEIRAVKLLCAQKGYDEYAKTLAPGEPRKERAAIVGGGPAGMAAAFLLARAGVKVTLFEERSELGGTVRYAIPEFRISREAIDRDAGMLRLTGVDIRLNQRINSARELREMGFTHVLLACGALKSAPYAINGTDALPALRFLEEQKRGVSMALGESVAVIGGGNTAMDAARAAKRADGVRDVAIVYRRMVAQMPADESEIKEALSEGVRLMELALPESWRDGALTCRVMRLGSPDESGRQRPEPTDETVTVKADSVIAATGTLRDEEFISAFGADFVLGDARRGPATVVEAIADALSALHGITGEKPIDIPCEADTDELAARRGKLRAPGETQDEFSRCLGCGELCENCVSVCPNRANIALTVFGRPQIAHIDAMCNECGNCAAFCPYEGSPYKDKWTAFSTMEDFKDSQNQGFYGDMYRYNGREQEGVEGLPDEIRELTRALRRDIRRLTDTEAKGT